MVHPFLVEEFRSTQVLFGGSSGARVAVLSLVIWEMFGAENVSHYYGLASGLGGDVVGSEKVHQVAGLRLVESFR